MIKLVGRGTKTGIVNMLHRFKNMDENIDMIRAHVEDFFFKTKMELLTRKTKMFQMKVH